jgi:hypothetical protein
VTKVRPSFNVKVFEAEAGDRRVEVWHCAGERLLGYRDAYIVNLYQNGEETDYWVKTLESSAIEKAKAQLVLGSNHTAVPATGAAVLAWCAVVLIFLAAAVWLIAVG